MVDVLRGPTSLCPGTLPMDAHGFRIPPTRQVIFEDPRGKVRFPPQSRGCRNRSVLSGQVPKKARA